MKEMLSVDVKELDIQDLVIPAEKVAHVQIGNPLEHALLLLTKTGYSAISVLDPSFRLQGIISKTLILDFTMGIERIELEKLSEYCVEDVMRTNIPCVTEHEKLLQAIKLTIDENFLCVTGEDYVFKGILPRSSLLKFLNHYLRELGRDTER